MSEAMTAPAVPYETPQNAERHWYQHNVSKVVGTLVLGAGTLLGINTLVNNSAEADGAPLASADEMALSCETADFADLSSSGTYASEAFLPKAEKALEPGDVRSRVFGLYEEGAIDKKSQAALMAAIVIPATDKEVADVNYNYVAAYNDTLKSYNAPGGIEQARDDCADVTRVFEQLAVYEEQFAENGELVGRIESVRGNKADNAITGMQLTAAPANEIGAGVLFENNAEARGFDGFTPVLLTEEGTLLIKGVTPIESNADEQNEADAPEDGKDAVSPETASGLAGASSLAELLQQAAGGGNGKNSGDQGSTTGSGSNGSTGSNSGGGAGDTSGKSDGNGQGGGGAGSSGGAGGGTGGGQNGCGTGCGEGGQGGGGDKPGGGGGGGGGGDKPNPPREEPPREEPPREEPPEEEEPTPKPTPTPTPPPVKPPMEECDPAIDVCE